MFDSLDEKIKHDEVAENSPAERIIKGTVIALLSIFLFGALYLGIRMIG
jgi:hypothetical protein